MNTDNLICSFVFSQGVDSGRLFKAEEFTPYDPTQDAIFPPELMVKLDSDNFDE